LSPSKNWTSYTRNTDSSSSISQTFVVCEKIIVEIKALNQLTSHDQAQLLNYLKATGLAVGVLINFGAEKHLEWKRMVWSK
jgi:GxxExxY protein